MKHQKITIGLIPAIIWGDKSNKAYIFVHGKMGCKEEASAFAEEVEKKGFQVISFDLPEHGERKNNRYSCSVQNGVKDLNTIMEYANKKWQGLSLYAISLGAYFSLVAYQNYLFENCLFISPVLDMERLINNMMKWFGVSEEDLEIKKEIPTPIGETLSWDYLMYVKGNRINTWNSKTEIIYGENDNITEREVIDDFVQKYKAKLTVIKNGEHYLHSDEEGKKLNEWIKDNV